MMTGGVLVFIGTLSASYSVGLVPYYVDGTQPEVGRIFASRGDTFEPVAAFPGASERVALANLPQLGNGAQYQSRVPAFEPERITINGVSVDLPVLNPNSTDISVLDEALKEGAVRYPLSALPGQDGNVLIFGHSSNLPIVHNQMYKAFNQLPELEEGDVIKLQGGGQEYVYRVTSLRRTDANEELIDLSPTQGRKLTLSTCDNFGTKSARWVVEAEFVGAYSAS